VRRRQRVRDDVENETDDAKEYTEKMTARVSDAEKAVGQHGAAGKSEGIEQHGASQRGILVCLDDQVVGDHVGNGDEEIAPCGDGA
jgi:hypothetical protein